MSGFGQNDGFYQGNFYEQQSAGYDMGPGGQQFGGEQQFAQFDYSQTAQGYGDSGAYYAGQQSYMGSILTPDASQFAQGPGTENFDEEPPLMEELGINFDHIIQKV
ncbi:protein YIPF5-like [Liolophura sinensis]|uniref:protein YIPF5-like n=1 Tax=Liolophura sinensis TaxID=3198878 RepID=UPI00315904AC